jgi:hypothetical protein
MVFYAIDISVKENTFLSTIVAIQWPQDVYVRNILTEIIGTAHIAFIVISRDRNDVLAINRLQKAAYGFELVLEGICRVIASVYQKIGRIAVQFLQQQLIIALPMARTKMHVRDV